MKTIHSFILAATFSLFFVFGTNAQTATANYTISFQGTWSDTSHPYPSFPSNAHWSNLVGALHNSNVIFVSADCAERIVRVIQV